MIFLDNQLEPVGEREFMRVSHGSEAPAEISEIEQHRKGP